MDGGVYLLGISKSNYDRAAFTALPWETGCLQTGLSGYAQTLSTGISWLVKKSDVDNSFGFFAAMGRSEGSIYKALKDTLLRLSFLELKDRSEIEEKRLALWDKYKAFQQLVIYQKRAAAVNVAVELIGKSQKAGVSEMVVGLASFLEGHFGGIALDRRRYLRYRKLRRRYVQTLNDELSVKALQTKLVFTSGGRKNWKVWHAK